MRGRLYFQSVLLIAFLFVIAYKFVGLDNNLANEDILITGISISSHADLSNDVLVLSKGFHQSSSSVATPSSYSKTLASSIATIKKKSDTGGSGGGSNSCEVISSDGSTRPHRVVVALSSAYMPLALNWLALYVWHCPNKLDNVYFICLDVQSQRKLYDTLGMNCSHVARSGDSRNRMWLMRTKVVSSLLEQGLDIFLNDLDAIWVKNPYQVINRYIDKVDMISSRSSFPEETEEILGAAICMGFVYIKGTPISLEVLDGLSSHLQNIKYPDDQRVINKLFISLGLHFDRRLTHGDKSLTTDFGHFASRNGNVRFDMALLSSLAFPRLCPSVTDKSKFEAFAANAIVAHCLFNLTELSDMERFEINGEYASNKDEHTMKTSLSLKNSVRKEKMSKQYGLWALKSNYGETVKPSALLTEKYIGLISVLAFSNL